MRRTVLLLALGTFGCLDPGDAGNLVPATADEDPRLPQVEVRVGVEAGGLISTRVSSFGAAGFQAPLGGLGLVTFPDVGRLPLFMTVAVGVALGPFRG